MKIQRLYSKGGQKYSNKELIEGVRNKDNNVLKYIYKEYFDQISQFLVKGGMLNKHDAEDIFQEGLLILWDNFQNSQDKMRYNFYTYFSGICRNLLMERLKLEYKVTKERLIDFEQIPDEHYEIISPFFPLIGLESVNKNEIKYQLFIKHFKMLKDDCKRVLKMAYAGISHNEIANRMGYKKGTFPKNKKHRCKEYLINSIKKDRLFKLLMNE